MFVELSNVIRTKRTGKGWTQKKLAQKAKISQSTVCRSEIDTFNIKFGYITQILEILLEKDFNLFKNEFLLEDSQVTVFLEHIMKDTRAWALINYDAQRTASFFIKVINDNYKKF